MAATTTKRFITNTEAAVRAALLPLFHPEVIPPLSASLEDAITGAIVAGDVELIGLRPIVTYIADHHFFGGAPSEFVDALVRIYS